MLLRPLTALLIHFLLLITASADLISIRNALDTINEGLRRGDIAILGLQNGTGPALLALQAQTIPLLQNATAVIEASAPLNFADSQSLVFATQALRFNINVTIYDLAAQKPILVAVNQTGSVLNALSAQMGVALRLGTALLSKLDPEATQAQASLQQVADLFNRGIEIFSNTDTSNSSTMALSGPFDPTADLSPVFIILPSPPVTGMGTFVDGQCACVVECPAGSFMGQMVTQRLT